MSIRVIRTGPLVSILVPRCSARGRPLPSTHDEIRRMLRAVVADVADPIYECGDAGEACAAYGIHRPEWVPMNVSMLPMDGVTATRQIVEAFPDARIVMVTQYDDIRLRNAAHNAGACGYVVKDNLFEVRRFLTPAT